MHQRVRAVADCDFTKFGDEGEAEMSDTTKTPRAHAAMTTPHHDDSGSVSSPPKPRWMPFTPPKPSQHPDGYCDPVKARPVE